MRKEVVIWLMVAALFAGTPLSAQIYSCGDDPGRARWMHVDSPNYRIIYPEGTDSLAMEYGRALERFRTAEGRSLGMVPGTLQFGKRTPVVLHPYTVYSNGSVMWAPKRMDLYTTPDPYAGETMPWSEQLAVHESRHVAQMQMAYRRGFRPLNYILGEVWPGALVGLYPGTALLEGDAVAAETGLTMSGRARSADFLGYMRLAFSEGDWRNFYRWRYGSFKHFAPDYYKAGYLLVGGMRAVYDEPHFSRKYYDRVVNHPFGIGNLQKVTREISGKRFRDTFRDVQEEFNRVWKADSAARAPFMPSEVLTRPGRFPVDYSSEVFAGGRHFIIHEGYVRSRTLDTLDDDDDEKERPICAFADESSALQYDEAGKKIWWSEPAPHVRWSLSGTSRIGYMTVPEDGAYKRKTLVKGRYFNPHPSPDGKTVRVTEYPVAGGSRFVELDASTGKVLSTHEAPPGVQLTESAGFGDSVYALGIAGNGYGMWRLLPDGSWKEEIAPVRAVIRNLSIEDDCIDFVSDLDGTMEWYHYYPATGKAWRVTNLEFGGNDFAVDDGYVYYSSPTLKGRMLMRTPVDSLKPVEADFTHPHTYPLEDRLTAQEKALAGDAPAATDSVTFSRPERYRKFPHLMKIHSWTPVWFNFDKVKSMSMDLSFDTASPGVLAMFQNDLGTASGTLGYSIRPNPSVKGKWKNALTATFTYSGLFPVFELSGAFNERDAVQYRVKDIATPDNGYVSISAGRMALPSLNGTARVYVPLNLSGSGWSRGLVPQVKYSISNDRFNSAGTAISYLPGLGGTLSTPVFNGVGEGRNVLMQSFSTSLRGYVMRPVPQSGTYPLFGIGFEAGYHFRPGLGSVFSPSVYGYLYGYLPGILQEQGLRVSAMAQRQFLTGSRLGEGYAVTTPRGFSGMAGTFIFRNFPTQLKISADYAIPIYVGDISALSPVAYIKNFLLVPHFDYGTYSVKSVSANLFSAGADFTVELANVLWIPFSGSVGVTWSYNWGSAMKYFKAAGIDDGRNYFGLVFSVDI